MARDTDEVDRDAWARLLTEVLAARDLTPETAAHPVGPVEVNWRTMRKWISRETGVTAKKVRDTLRSLDYPPTRGLVEVGFLEPGEVGIVGLAAPPAPKLDPLARKINSALTTKYVTDRARRLLRQGLQAVYDTWFDAHRNGDAPPDRVPTRPRKDAKTRR